MTIIIYCFKKVKRVL